MVNARRTIGKHYPKSHTKYFDNLKYDVSWGGGGSKYDEGGGGGVKILIWSMT